jgi:hypothetical protein
MREKKQFSHAQEFQITYTDSLLSQKETINLHSVSVGCEKKLSSQQYNMDREKKKGMAVQLRNWSNTTSAR